MTKYELLEFSAKAAGIKAEWLDEEYSREGMWFNGERTVDNNKFWNPLEDDGDAFRLAAKLNLILNFSDDMVSARDNDDDYYFRMDTPGTEMMRYVIVRAAAKIGKSL